VLQKTTIPFPQVKPGDIVIKVSMQHIYTAYRPSYFRPGGILWCKFHRYLLQVIKSYSIAHLFYPDHSSYPPYRQGLYKYESFPAVIGKETSGIIVGLPADEAVLNNETFKSQGFKIGGKVAAVSLFRFYMWMTPNIIIF